MGPEYPSKNVTKVKLLYWETIKTFFVKIDLLLRIRELREIQHLKDHRRRQIIINKR
jgi:hypothetical protein